MTRYATLCFFSAMFGFIGQSAVADANHLNFNYEVGTKTSKGPFKPVFKNHLTVPEACVTDDQVALFECPNRDCVHPIVTVYNRIDTNKHLIVALIRERRFSPLKILSRNKYKIEPLPDHGMAEGATPGGCRIAVHNDLRFGYFLAPRDNLLFRLKVRKGDNFNAFRVKMFTAVVKQALDEPPQKSHSVEGINVNILQCRSYGNYAIFNENTIAAGRITYADDSKLSYDDAIVARFGTCNLVINIKNLIDPTMYSNNRLTTKARGRKGIFSYQFSKEESEEGNLDERVTRSLSFSAPPSDSQDKRAMVYSYDESRAKKLAENSKLT